MKHRVALLGTSAGTWATPKPNSPLARMMQAYEAQKKAGGAPTPRK